MLIYVGRWDLLPEDWEGVNGLYVKSQADIEREVDLEEYEANNLCLDDRYIGKYTPEQFEEEINHFVNDSREGFSCVTHWIKFFDDDGRKLVGQRIEED
jgi:hypothetical protein